MRRFPRSGEVNFMMADVKTSLAAVLAYYVGQDPELDYTDGLSADFQWRFNLRSSNTEPLVRRSAESRGSPALVDDKVGEISRLLAAA